MADIIDIEDHRENPPTFLRECPACGYRIADLEFRLERYTRSCPRCATNTISDFIRVER